MTAKERVSVQVVYSSAANYEMRRNWKYYPQCTERYVICMSGSDHGLIDLNDVQIDRSLPVEKRIESFVSQIGNPYHYKVGEVVVRVCYSPDGKPLDECFRALVNAE